MVSFSLAVSLIALLLQNKNVKQCISILTNKMRHIILRTIIAYLVRLLYKILYNYMYRVLRKFEDIIQKDTKCLIKHLDFIKLCYFNLERVSCKI